MGKNEKRKNEKREKSGHPEFKSLSNHHLELFQVAPGSTPRLLLYLAN